MPTPLSQRQAELRLLISDFLSERRNDKTDKLADDNPKLKQTHEKFLPDVWLADAARRVTQIQAVTHSLKPVHPDAKGSSLLCDPAGLPSLEEVGSHALGTLFDIDVAGNAAALDVYKFLKLKHQGRSLLSLAVDADADFAVALSDQPAKAAAWMSAFASLVDMRSKLSSHTLAKQLYWPVGADPHDDSAYHLLAPLYPTSLVHRVYQTIQDDRFSDEAKAARDASKGLKWHDRPVREYRNLVVQKLGGSNKQNISQLNSERQGDNYLLASVPPVWRSVAVRPVLGVDSMFKPFGGRLDVRTLVANLRTYLEGDPERNKATRVRRDDMVEALLDELVQFTAELRTLAAGWSTAPTCDLPAAHCAWLDPDGSTATETDVGDRIADDFARWLNGQLRNPLQVGDPEYQHWRKQARDLLSEEEREGVL